MIVCCCKMKATVCIGGVVTTSQGEVGWYLSLAGSSGCPQCPDELLLYFRWYGQIVFKEVHIILGNAGNVRQFLLCPMQVNA